VAQWQAGQAGRARVTAADGELQFHRRGSRERLIPVAPHRFRRQGDPAVSVVFVEHDGDLYLQGELGNFVREAPDGDDGVSAPRIQQ
jgi:hypothetical protein